MTKIVRRAETYCDGTGERISYSLSYRSLGENGETYNGESKDCSKDALVKLSPLKLW